MLLHHVSSAQEPIETIKLVLGRAVEERRKRLRVTQNHLADEVGISVRWLREIEAGNPRSTMENHLRCWAALGLPVSHIFVPVMFTELDMRFPLEMLDNTALLQEQCLQFFREYCTRSFMQRFQGSGRDL